MLVVYQNKIYKLLGVSQDRAGIQEPAAPWQAQNVPLSEIVFIPKK
jgi:hypothetical protein